MINNKPIDFGATRIDIAPFVIDIDGIYKVEVSNNDILKESNDITHEIRGN